MPATKKSHIVFAAFGNVNRRKIIDLLLSGEKNVTSINAVVKITQPALSQHLAKLRKAKIVSHRREGRMIFYSLSNPALVEQITSDAEALLSEV